MDFPLTPPTPSTPAPLPAAMLDGVLPSRGDVETEAKLPDFIPADAIVEVRTVQDVDDLPRGALAHLIAWDEDLAFDLVGAGAGLTLIDRATQESLAQHDDFDAEGFGIIDERGLWVPGLDVPYERVEGGWRLPRDASDAAHDETSRQAGQGSGPTGAARADEEE